MLHEISQALTTFFLRAFSSTLLFSFSVSSVIKQFIVGVIIAQRLSSNIISAINKMFQAIVIEFTVHSRGTLLMSIHLPRVFFFFCTSTFFCAFMLLFVVGTAQTWSLLAAGLSKHVYWWWWACVRCAWTDFQSRCGRRFASLCRVIQSLWTGKTKRMRRFFCRKKNIHPGKCRQDGANCSDIPTRDRVEVRRMNKTQQKKKHFHWNNEFRI